MAAPVLEVRDLRVQFRRGDAVVRAVDGVSLRLEAGRTVALVGESGCGKSVTAMALMRLLAGANVRTAGSVQLEGRELLTLPEAQMRALRGSAMGMVFQEPMTSLNPVLTVGWQIAEPLRLHQRLGAEAAHARAVELLQWVGIADPARRAREYPHQLSGGMRQRVMIAMALACEPRVLVADEPTTALDVTVQAQILELLRGLQQRLGTAILLITHDLGVVAEVADRVVVMYAGRVVEEGTVTEVLRTPLHPYTQGLLRAMPPLRGPRVRLAEIPGQVPSLAQPLAGCAFADRCDRASARCRDERPPLRQLADGRSAACHHAAMPGSGPVAAPMPIAEEVPT